MSSDHSAVSVHEHPPPSFGVPNLKLAFWLFLASDCMLFGSLIATYLSYRGKDQLFGNGPYPLDLFSVEVTTISTFDLLMSSVTMVLAVAAIQRGNMFQTRLWLALTALLGAIFVGFQGYEFTHFYLEGDDLHQTQEHGDAPERRGRRAVLALRRHRLDRHLHPRLPDGVHRMSGHDSHAHAGGHDEHEHKPTSISTYLGVAAVLTPGAPADQVVAVVRQVLDDAAALH